MIYSYKNCIKEGYIENCVYFAIMCVILRSDNSVIYCDVCASFLRILDVSRRSKLDASLDMALF